MTEPYYTTPRERATTITDQANDEARVYCCLDAHGRPDPPLVTAVLVAAVIIAYHTGGAAPSLNTSSFSASITYAAGESAWYTSLSASLGHLHPTHLWSNVAMLAAAGALCEVTEGHLRMVLLAWGGATLGFGFYGAIAQTGSTVVGISGIIYALIWVELAMLALNWSQMFFRWLRLGGMLALLTADLVLYLAGQQGDSVAFWAHVGGQLAGILIGLAIGVNVVRQAWEVWLRVIGVVGVGVMVIVVMARQQIAAGVLGALLLPFLVAKARYDMQRAARQVERLASGGTLDLAKVLPVNPNDGPQPRPH